MYREFIFHFAFDAITYFFWAFFFLLRLYLGIKTFVVSALLMSFRSFLRMCAGEEEWVY